jgi:hypothetical protein
LAFGLVAAVVATTVAACSSGYWVSLRVEPQVEGSALVIAGWSNLPTGARLHYTATSRVANRRCLSGVVVCSYGRFQTREDVSTWPPGMAEITVTFDPRDPGPAELRDRCGRNGALLDGTGVVKRGRVKVVEAHGTIYVPGRLSVRAAEMAGESSAPPPAGGTGLDAGTTAPGPDITTVYVTRTGTKYHRPNCQYLSKSCSPLSLEEAKRRDYELCSVCRPPP